MGEISIPVPSSIFCPKCGELMKMERIQDAQTRAKLEEAGYATGARGMCECGIVAVLCIKAMPENPTFTLLMNLYSWKTEEKIKKGHMVSEDWSDGEIPKNE